MASALSGTFPMIICCERSTGSSTCPRFVRILGPYYSDVGRPSIDPELMIRMLIVGYCLGIRRLAAWCRRTRKKTSLARCREPPDFADKPTSARTADGAGPRTFSRRAPHRRNRVTRARRRQKLTPDNFLKRPELMTASEQLATQVGGSRARSDPMATGDYRGLQRIGY